MSGKMFKTHSPMELKEPQELESDFFGKVYLGHLNNYIKHNHKNVI